MSLRSTFYLGRWPAESVRDLALRNPSLPGGDHILGALLRTKIYLSPVHVGITKSLPLSLFLSLSFSGPETGTWNVLPVRPAAS